MGLEKRIFAQFTVEGMKCDGCVDKVKKAMEKHKGIADINISLEDNLVKFIYDPNSVSLSKIEKAIRDAGYMVADKVEKEL